MSTTTMRRRDRQGRFLRLCRGSAWGTECPTEARYYISGYGYYGLMGSNGQATHCLTHARRRLRRLRRTDGWYRSTYRIIDARTNKRVS